MPGAIFFSDPTCPAGEPLQSFRLRRIAIALSFGAMADPLKALSPAELARYSRHILLDEVGVDGQRKLAAARVLVVGAGGLGSPAALYLAAAGIGTIGIADFDRVEEHNLQRQLLHDTSSVGEPKVSSAARRLRAVNPHVKIVTHDAGITVENAIAIFSEYDVIVDGTDRFAVRYLNNDAAFFAQRPLVYGSVFKFEGQVAVFASAQGGPCYRCLFPEPPASGSVPGCGEAGVLGALCGVIGSLQALEAIKLIVGLGQPLIGRLLTYDARHQDFNTLTLPRNPACPLCGERRSIHALRVEPACAVPPPPPMSATDFPLEVSVAEAKAIVDAQPGASAIIDVREPYEIEICRVAGAEYIPMRQIPERLATLPRDKHLLILCHSGARSLRVTEFLRARDFPAVSNIAGGIDAWAEEIDPAMRRY
jgi:molybdopterin/thiamine biosynthesis adenylyltransferase/rhodanese-related sulfurtransferase